MLLFYVKCVYGDYVFCASVDHPSAPRCRVYRLHWKWSFWQNSRRENPRSGRKSTVPIHWRWADGHLCCTHYWQAQVCTGVLKRCYTGVYRCTEQVLLMLLYFDINIKLLCWWRAKNEVHLSLFVKRYEIRLFIYRSLVAYLAAANLYKKDFLIKPDIWQHVEKADYFYIAVSSIQHLS